MLIFLRQQQEIVWSENLSINWKNILQIHNYLFIRMKFVLILMAFGGAVTSLVPNGLPPPPPSKPNQNQLKHKGPLNQLSPLNQNFSPNSQPRNQNLPTSNQNIPHGPFQGKLAVNLPGSQKPQFGSNMGPRLPVQSFMTDPSSPIRSVDSSFGASPSSLVLQEPNVKISNFNFDQQPFPNRNNKLPRAQNKFDAVRDNFFRRQESNSRFRLENQSSDFTSDWRMKPQSIDFRRSPRSFQENVLEDEFKNWRFVPSDFNRGLKTRLDRNVFTQNNRFFGQKSRRLSFNASEIPRYPRRDFNIQSNFDEFNPQQNFDSTSFFRPSNSFGSAKNLKPNTFEVSTQQVYFPQPHNSFEFNSRFEDQPRSSFLVPNKRNPITNSPTLPFQSTPQSLLQPSYYPEQNRYSKHSFNDLDNDDFRSNFGRFQQMKSGKDSKPNITKRIIRTNISDPPQQLINLNHRANLRFISTNE